MPEVTIPVQGAYIADKKAAIKGALELGNVDNTSDADKPVSTLTQTALNLKANLASPTFTGTVGGITKTMVGLANVDNTTDLNKPISTATQDALDDKQDAATAVTSVRPDANHLEASTFLVGNLLAIYESHYNALELAGQLIATTAYLILEDPAP
jgi:hypothetical protein